MKLEIKLKQTLKLLLTTSLPNRKELFNEYTKLKKLLNSPVQSENLSTIIKHLKANLFYQQFKLETDPIFLTTLVNKITDYEIIKELLELPDIHYSRAEERYLDQRIDILFSLSSLEREIIELKKFQETMDIDNHELANLDEDFYDVYLEDIQKLKNILGSESTSLENIEWFLDSDLFEFILGISDCSDIEPVDIYKSLLKNTEITAKEQFIRHKQLLTEIEHENFEYPEFYKVLLRNSPPILTSNAFRTTIFKKFSNLKKISPQTRQAFANNLKNYEEQFHLIKLKC